MNKWYMHNPESVLENEKPKILWKFEIQTNHLISARWPNQVIVNKKKKDTCRIGLNNFDSSYDLKKAWNYDFKSLLLKYKKLQI